MEEGSCQHRCSLSVPFLALHWISQYIFRIWETWCHPTCFRTSDVNFSRSLNALSSMSTLDPRAWNAERNSGCFLRSVSFPSSHKSTGRIATCKWVQSYKSQVNLISEIFGNGLNIYKSAVVTRSSVKQHCLVDMTYIVLEVKWTRRCQGISII